MAAKFRQIILAMLAANAASASPVSREPLDNVDVQAILGDKLEISRSSSEAMILPRHENLEREVGICSYQPNPKITNQKIQLVVIDMVPKPEPRSLKKTLRKLQADIPKKCLTKIGRDKAIHAVNAPSTYITEYGSYNDLVWNVSYSSLVNAPDTVPNLIIIPLTSDCKPRTYNKFLKKVTSHVPVKLLSVTGGNPAAQWSRKTRSLAFLTKEEILVSGRLQQPRETNKSACGTEIMELVQLKAEGGFHGPTGVAAASPSDTVRVRSDSEYPTPPGGYPPPPGGYPAPSGGYPVPPGGY